MRPPRFWYGADQGLIPQLLRPAAALVSLAGAWRRHLTTPWKAPVPVICVGNLTSGGAGKTPTVIALAKLLAEQKLAVHIVSRGYGAQVTTPLRIEPGRHGVRDVGDEALLLAQVAPTWVSPDRRASAKRAIDSGAQVLLMDDGFQNPTIHKDMSIVVVDGGAGIGNGYVLPAGPLREPVARGLVRADALLIIGEDQRGVEDALVTAGTKSLPVMQARLVPAPAAPDMSGQKVYAFAGIGRPQKFFDTLTELGCELAGTEAFDDHHVYSVDEIDTLVQKAAHMGAQLITTAKDRVRLDAASTERVASLDVELQWQDSQLILDRLASVLPAPS